MSQHDAEDAAVGALLGTFAGDALGVPYEGAGPARRFDGARLRKSAARAHLLYSDDTQLTLALAEHLIEHPGVDPAALVESILLVYEPERGYGGGMRRVVAAWQQGLDLETAARAAFPDGSFGNGAAMRIAAVGVAWAGDPERRAVVAERSARITHLHPVGVDGARLQAHAVARAATGRRFTADDVGVLAEAAATEEMATGLVAAHERAGRHARGERSRPAEIVGALGHDAVVHRSLPAALWCAAVADDLAGGIGLALDVGGDADTIAAMTGAVLGAAAGAEAVRSDWLGAMENGLRGVAYARGLGSRLAARPAVGGG